MNCPTCGYELTLLLTSSVCDKCDGLVVTPQPSAAPTPRFVQFSDWSDLKPGRKAEFCRQGLALTGQVDWATNDVAQITWNDSAGPITYFANLGQVDLFRECLLLAVE